MIFPRPPAGPEPPRPPDFRGEPAEFFYGLVAAVLAIAAVTWLGFWWGIAVFAVSFLLVAFVGGVNLASRGQARSPRHRPPFSARVHAIASALLAGVLCYGIGAAVGLADSRGIGGTAAAAAAYVVLSEGMGWILDRDWTGAFGSWCLLGIVVFLLDAPIAAYIAPGYEVHGVFHNAAITVLIIGTTWLVTVASPWRRHWSTSTEP